MGHGVRWGRDLNLSPKVTAFHRTDRVSVSRPPSLGARLARPARLATCRAFGARCVDGEGLGQREQRQVKKQDAPFAWMGVPATVGQPAPA